MHYFLFSLTSMHHTHCRAIVAIVCNECSNSSTMIHTWAQTLPSIPRVSTQISSHYLNYCTQHRSDYTTTESLHSAIVRRAIVEQYSVESYINFRITSEYKFLYSQYWLYLKMEGHINCFWRQRESQIVFGMWTFNLWYFRVYST